MNNRLLISEAFELYRLEHIVYLNQSKKTEEMSTGAMNSLISYVGDIPISCLTFDLIRKWKEELEKTRGQNTVRGYIIKLRVVLKHLALKGYKNTLNPEMVGVPRRKEVVVDFLTPKEVDILINTAFEDNPNYPKITRYRNRAIIALLYASGIRISELCALDRNSIQLDSNSFTVIGKGNRARLCFFDPRTRDYILTYLALREDSDPALFLATIAEWRITPGRVQEIFRMLSDKASLGKAIHPHILRHSFATNMLKNNTNLLYVSKFLGHKSVQTTEMYTHVVDEDLRSIYAEKHTV